MTESSHAPMNPESIEGFVPMPLPGSRNCQG
jgi:hypothetical protein